MLLTSLLPKRGEKKEQEPATHDPDVQIMVEQPESNIPPETIRYINEIVQEMDQQE